MIPLVLPLLLAAAAACAQPAPPPRPAPDPGRPVHAEAAAVDPALSSDRVRVLGALALTGRHRAFGGFSGVLIDGDGAGLTLVSDRGALVTARLVRQGDRLAGLADVRLAALTGPDGRPRRLGADDAEALARAPDGALLIAFEGDDPRIWRYASPGARAERAPDAEGFGALQRNSGLEALAVGPDGAIYALPERSGDTARPFPVFRLAPGAEDWDIGTFERRPPFLVTGADVGPDGMLYVVERDFSLLGGFSWRLSRADPADWPALRPETLLTARGGLDNVESVSLWRDPAGRLRALLIADDNFQPIQRSLLLELEIL
jgi:hypothetical protein